LILEVTESALLRDAVGAVACLQELRAAGFRIALDDFGTGYSSLSYLEQLPVGILKIDRSFVSGLHPGNTRSKLVRAVLELARALGLEVIAEGVETEGQRDLLLDLGCERAQGYLFGRSMGPTLLAATLRRVPNIADGRILAFPRAV
jgi:EAL domain-containing protein (putative c-di-GMP-specific phosphodiesterase class I)